MNEAKSLKNLQNELEQELRRKGADIIRYADLSEVPGQLNKKLDKSIIIGVLLSKEYMKNLLKPDYSGHDEFTEKERLTDSLAEWTACFLTKKGYNAFAQSEKSLMKNGFFNPETKTSLLPVKTIALIAGMGWIGKNNLLVTPEYGCAFSMCSVLTDAPIDTEKLAPLKSKCGGCEICKQVCPPGVLTGNNWYIGCNRDTIVDAFHCETCLKCLSHCKWTINYTLQ